ncbi:MAG: hypothetical protein ABEJ56_05510 [Candidatus Nanohaloarchaea archaeon]
MSSEFGEEEWKATAEAFAFSGLAYIFVDVALSGVINYYSVVAYIAVFIIIVLVGNYRISSSDK